MRGVKQKLSDQPKPDKPWMERIKRVRKSLHMSQQAFADAMGVTQPTVSEWEFGGKYDPSAETFIKLGNMSPEPVDQLWFWQQAGLEKEKAVGAIAQMLKERNSEPASGEIVRVPIRNIFQKKGDVAVPEELIPLPSRMVSSPEATFAVEVPNDILMPFLRTGDIVIIDGSLNDLHSHPGGLVAASHNVSDTAWTPEKLREIYEKRLTGWGIARELLKNPEEIERRVRAGEYPFLRDRLVIGWLRRVQFDSSGDHHVNIELPKIEGFETHPAYRSTVNLAMIHGKEFAATETEAKEIGAELLTRQAPYVHFLGRVVAIFSVTANKLQSPTVGPKKTARKAPQKR